MPKFEMFKPYEGDKPYIFISYAHANDAQVLPIISDMHKRGYKIWYDEGIEVGSEWQECIASHLADAHLVIAFISNAYIKSDNCRREMHYALSKRIKTINVFLEQTELTPGMELQLGNIFALMKYTYPSEEYFYEKLYTAPLLSGEEFGDADSSVKPVSTTLKLSDKKADKERSRQVKEEKRQIKEEKREQRRSKSPEEKAAVKKKAKKFARLSVVLALLGCLIAALIVGYFTGFFQRVLTPRETLHSSDLNAVVQFKYDIFEAAAREYTGIESGKITVGDLRGLTELYICGGEYWFKAPQSHVEVESVADSTASIRTSDGTTVEVSRGDIKDLSDLEFFTDLKTLRLEFQSLNNLSTLPVCGIEDLSLCSCRLASLDGIGKLPQLFSLNVDGNPLADLGDLNKCLQLREISCLGSSCHDLSVFKPLNKIDRIAFSHCSLSGVAHILDHSSLRYITLRDSDLRGGFFRSFDSERSIVSLDLSGSKLDSTAGIEDFTALTELRISGCTGISSWSCVSTLTSLQTIYISDDQQQALGEISAAIVVE